MREYPLASLLHVAFGAGEDVEGKTFVVAFVIVCMGYFFI